MKPASLAVYIFTVFAAALTARPAPAHAPSLDTAKEAINTVFAKYPKHKREVWPISDYARYTSVRPLRRSTFTPLRKYFSRKQQRNVDEFLQALNNLLDTRERLAKRLGMHEKWWPTGIDLLKVDAVLSRDLLTDRSNNPNQMTISTPKMLNGKVEFTVKEMFMEVGQDRILGRGSKTSMVDLVPEDGQWVIDEVTSTVVDAYGDTRIDTLGQLLREATKTLRNTEGAIQKLPQKLEIKRPNALRKASQPKS